MPQIIGENSEVHPPESSAPPHSTTAADDISIAVATASTPPRLPAQLHDLTERARGSANTRRAYASDWKHFSAWCRRQNLSPLPPDPEIVGLYITACASGTAERSGKSNSVSTIERRLAAIGWNCAQRGMPLDRKDRAIATVLAGIRNRHDAPPQQKEAICRRISSLCWRRSTGARCAA